jgi:hypothetical protein
MSKIYLLVDDEAKSDAPADGYAEKLSASSQGFLTINTYRPTSIEEVLEYVAGTKPDGLLLDVAFTNALTADRAPLAFDGIALAQQIRTLQTRGLRQSSGSSLPEFPLVRFSKADVIREYVSGDTTSDDLFDERIEKSEVIDRAHPVAARLVSLATDYPAISEYAATEEKSDDAVARLLGLDPDFLASLDARALLGLRRPNAPAHVLSRYVTGPLLGRPGPLIEESLLAVRLGIDWKNSKDWPAVLESLKPAAYKGVFGLGYVRWWMPRVLAWWSETIDEKQAPFRVSAADRVRTIQAKIGIEQLVPIAENADSPGTKFWHRCIKSNLPVDPTFGFPLMPEWGQETWHDVDYLCQEEAMRDPRNPRLSSAERSRVAKLRKGKNPA